MRKAEVALAVRLKARTEELKARNSAGTEKDKAEVAALARVRASRKEELRLKEDDREL